MKTLACTSSVYRTSFLTLIILYFLNSSARAQEHVMDTSVTKAAHVMLIPADLKWGDGPAGLPAGAKAVVLEGDPSKPGLFTLRLKFPANYKIPAHWHPSDEHVTVLSGTLMIGMGDSFVSKNMKSLSAGSYASMPAKSNHFAMANGETVVQIHAMGPFGVTYINPADDPRNKK